MKLVSKQEMKEIEKEADASGLSFVQMMENAGNNLAHKIIELFHYENEDEEEEIQVLGLVGPGNNGGDTLTALIRLAEKGWTVRAYLVDRKSENDLLLEKLKNVKGEVYNASEDINFQQLSAFIHTTDMILDGILGTGIRLPLDEIMDQVLSKVNEVIATVEEIPLVIAIDCPSGVNCDTGETSKHSIPADITITMAAVKQGLLKLPAYDFVGELIVIGIGDLSTLSHWQEIKNEVADEELISTFLPARDSGSHKGSFGTAIITAGSLNYTGAALLAGKAAARIGTGLVTMAIPATLHSAISGHFPEATWILLPHELGVLSEHAADVLLEEIGKASVMLLGPGLGVEETTRAFLLKLLTKETGEKTSDKKIGFIKGESSKKTEPEHKGLPPLVLDADGLKLLAKIDKWNLLLPITTILTPHPGEMSILTSLSVEEIQSNRLEIARQYSIKWGHVLVLKGAFTIIASPDGRTTTIPVATSALAHAGTGDVLAGIITGLRAQGIDAYEAAIAGTWIHAQAGIMAAEFLSTPTAVLAGDILDCVPDVLGEFYQS